MVINYPAEDAHMKSWNAVSVCQQDPLTGESSKESFVSTERLQVCKEVNENMQDLRDVSERTDYVLREQTLSNRIDLYEEPFYPK